VLFSLRYLCANPGPHVEICPIGEWSREAALILRVRIPALRPKKALAFIRRCFFLCVISVQTRGLMLKSAPSEDGAAKRRTYSGFESRRSDQKRHLRFCASVFFLLNPIRTRGLLLKSANIPAPLFSPT